MHITAKGLLVNKRTLIIICYNVVFNIQVKLLTYFCTLTGGAINSEKCISKQSICLLVSFSFNLWSANLSISGLLWNYLNTLMSKLAFKFDKRNLPRFFRWFKVPQNYIFTN